MAGLILCFFHEQFMQLGVPVHWIVLWCAVALTLTALVIYGRSAIEKYKAADAPQAEDAPEK